MHIVGIGLANIDLVAHVTDDFLTKHKVVKGQAVKFKNEKFLQLRSELNDIHIEAGGCVGNTLCGIGGKHKKTFFGKIGNDDYAKLYRESFKKYGVIYPVQNGEVDSSQCAVLITPDGERSFAYIHGASWTLAPDDIYFDSIDHSDLIYTEIYAMAFGMQTGLWPALTNHLRHARVPMAMKVVDKEYMDLYRTALFGLAEEEVLTLLVGNKDNICGLARRPTIDEAFDVLSKWKCGVLLTDGAGGAYYGIDGERYHHKVDIIETPVNTSGAGDQFVAGFIEKWMEGKSVDQCMKTAEEKARAVLMIDSPRP
ncbi:MAG TPA: PfkB family carbohydrate kinase [Alphaproteobacteria bacterium]|nr:PfkB family carbohydrate kinase [Alphaproteobacteria bacterium]